MANKGFQLNSEVKNGAQETHFLELWEEAQQPGSKGEILEKITV